MTAPSRITSLATPVAKGTHWKGAACASRLSLMAIQLSHCPRTPTPGLFASEVTASVIEESILAVCTFNLKPCPLGFPGSPVTTGSGSVGHAPLLSTRNTHSSPFHLGVLWGGEHPNNLRLPSSGGGFSGWVVVWGARAHTLAHIPDPTPCPKGSMMHLKILKGGG